ncbi:gamma-glutamyl-gamma-aminobutyrate hydrolase family protein [soil metagenome]
MAPLIGITCYVERARWRSWDRPAALLPLSYVRAVTEAGGRPVLVPPTEDEAALEDYVKVLDGLIASGGADIDPALYGAERHPMTDPLNPDRDGAEMRLLGKAMDSGVPVLGICRGMQMMNVARGGDLIQHLDDHTDGAGHVKAPGEFSSHSVTVSPGSRLGAIVGERTTVRSHHHQAPNRVGEGLTKVAWSEDALTEGLEAAGDPFTIGVLWHPEEEGVGPLFAALVEAADARS